MRRSLYECSQARVFGERIYCAKGRRLAADSEDGKLNIRRLAKGQPLVLDTCQECPHFNRMGPPVPEKERGWTRKGAPWKSNT